MARMSQKLEEAGWRTGSLIHDAIVIGKEESGRRPRDQQEEIEGIVGGVLDELTEERGWGRGLIRAKVSKM